MESQSHFLPLLKPNNQLQLLRKVKHVLEYRKGLVIGVLSLIAIGQMIYFHLSSSPNKQSKKEIEEELLKDTGGQMSDPSMINFLVLQEKEFKNRRITMRKACKGLSPGSAKYKPRNETLKFDILWDYNYQVHFKNWCRKNEISGIFFFVPF